MTEGYVRTQQSFAQQYRDMRQFFVRSALSGRCGFFREGSLVSMKNTGLPLQIPYAFNPTFKPAEKARSVT